MAPRAILCFLCQSVKSVDSLPGLSSYVFGAISVFSVVFNCGIW